MTTDESGIDKVTVNGSAVSVSSNGSFSKSVNLTEGTNTITIIATDIAGNTTTKRQTQSQLLQRTLQAIPQQRQLQSLIRKLFNKLLSRSSRTIQ
jgi:ADP-ribosylglycohydrolase